MTNEETQEKDLEETNRIEEQTDENGREEHTNKKQGSKKDKTSLL